MHGSSKILAFLMPFATWSRGLATSDGLFGSKGFHGEVKSAETRPGLLSSPISPSGLSQEQQSLHRKELEDGLNRLLSLCGKDASLTTRQFFRMILCFSVFLHAPNFAGSESFLPASAGGPSSALCRLSRCRTHACRDTE